MATLLLSSLLIWAIVTEKVSISSSTKQDINVAQDFLISEYHDILEGASDAITILVDKLENMVKSFENTPNNSNLEVTVN